MINSRNAAFAEESAEVEVLFAEAAKFDGISKRIKASLARLESGAQTVKNSIGPVHSNTQSLQTMNSSV
jgi:exocyst complex protein 7